MIAAPLRVAPAFREPNPDIRKRLRSTFFRRELDAAMPEGNDYRLVVAADFDKRIIWIKWIGTHGEYDQIDVTKVQYGRTCCGGRDAGSRPPCSHVHHSVRTNTQTLVNASIGRPVLNT